MIYRNDMLNIGTSLCDVVQENVNLSIEHCNADIARDVPTVLGHS